MTKLVCTECRRENEAERIFCHDCGARLDRSVLAKTKAKEENPKETQRRLRSMLDPPGAKVRQAFFHWSKLILGALAAAALVQMIRPPETPPRSKELLLPAQINLDLENAAQSPNSAPLRYTDQEVNAYFVYALKSKQAALSKWLRFERALAGFDEGVCRITVERSLMGYSVFASTSYGVSIKDGALLATNRGGSLGRLPVHPQIMQFAGFLFSDLWRALGLERKSIARLGGIEFHPQSVFLSARQQ